MILGVKFHGDDLAYDIFRDWFVVLSSFSKDHTQRFLLVFIQSRGVYDVFCILFLSFDRDKFDLAFVFANICEVFGVYDLDMFRSLIHYLCKNMFRKLLGDVLCIKSFYLQTVRDHVNRECLCIHKT